MMKSVLLLFVLMVGVVGCVPADVAGCPLEPSAAIGTPCLSPGVECGELSLCDPCGDTTECEIIVCSEAFVWEGQTLVGNCLDAGADG
jgi:hypothetical protein